MDSDIRREKGIKKTASLLMFMIMTLVLSGCMKMNIGIEVKADASAEMKMELLLQEAMLETSGTTVDEAIEQIENQMKSEDGFKDAKITRINKKIDGEKWAGFTIESKEDKEFTSYVEEKKIDGKDSLVLTLPMKAATGDSLNSETLSQSGYSVQQMKKLGMEMNVTIRMPQEATSNFGTVNGNEVTIDLLTLIAEGEKQDIVVSSAKASETSSMEIVIISGIIAGIAVIAGIAFLVIKKRKNLKLSSAEIETTMEVTDGTDDKETIDHADI